MINVATPSEIEDIVDYIEEDLTSGPSFDDSLGAANVYLASDVEVLSNDSQELKNVVVFTGTFDGVDYDLYVPYDSYHSLTIDNGALINVGSSTVQGYMLSPGDDIDISAYDVEIYNMNPIFGSTNNVYQYGSRNYQRHYYLQTSGAYDRITYDDTYGNFIVDDVSLHFASSERIYYLGFFIIALLGGILLCLRRLQH